MNRLTFPLKLLICFFAFDAVEKAAEVAALIARGVRFDSNSFVDNYFPLLLTFSFDVLLALQIYLRTRAGRFWGVIYLAAMTALGVYLHVVEPGRWAELGQAGRLKEIATYGVFAAFLGVLLSRRSARVLVR